MVFSSLGGCVVVVVIISGGGGGYKNFVSVVSTYSCLKMTLHTPLTFNSRDFNHNDEQ